MQDYEGAWVILLGVQYVFFREYCNTYELLLKSICNIRSSNSNMFFFINNANFDGQKVIPIKF